MLRCKVVKIDFRDEKLRQLAIGKSDSDYHPALVKVFRRRVYQIVSAVDERDIRLHKSLHFERLKGDRAHQHSIRLNDQFRLILELDDSVAEKTVVIVGIEDYH